MSEYPGENNETKELESHFIKTGSYRSYYVDGAFGGITSKGKLYVELYIERPAVPQRVVYKKLGNGWGEVSREGEDGLVRQIECGLVMDIQSAVALRDWLDSRIAEYGEMSERSGGSTADA